jgi:hypothetical protein
MHVDRLPTYIDRVACSSSSLLDRHSCYTILFEDCLKRSQDECRK